MKFASSILLTLILATSASQAAPLSTETLLTERDTDNFSGVRPSPDGGLAALDLSSSTESLSFDYANQTFTKTGYPMWASLSIFRLQLLDIASGARSAPGADTGISWGGNWSPDGQHYAFYSDRSGFATVWIWDRKTGAIRELNDAVIRMFRNDARPQWTADSRKLVYQVVPEGMTLQSLRQLSSTYRLASTQSVSDSIEPAVHVYDASGAPQQTATDIPGADFLDYRYLSDLAAVDVETGKLIRIAKRVHSIRFWISPDGSHVAYLSFDALRPNTQRGKYTLGMASVSGAEPKVLVDDVTPGDPTHLSWSPQSDRIAYGSQGGEHFDQWGCFVVDIHSGRKIEIHPPTSGQFTSLAWGAPLWSRDGSQLLLLDTPQSDEWRGGGSHLWSVSSNGNGGAREIGRIEGHRIEDIVTDQAGGTYWSPDSGTSAIVRTRSQQTNQHGFYRVDLRSDKVTRIGEYAAHIGRPLVGAVNDHKRITFLQSDVGHPSEVFSLDVSSGRTRRVSHFHKEFDSVPMGTSRLIEWLSPTGERLRGTLLTPPALKPGTRVPLVVWVYGGAFGSEALNRFGFGWGSVFNMQMLSTRGYAVLYPDVPMHEGRPVQDVLDAVLSGVNRAVEIGIADPERLAVMGQSFGGYNTQSIITHTNRFKAAIMTASATANLFAGYPRFEEGMDAGTGYYERGQGAMRSTPWENPLRYIENSPALMFDRVQTPLLIARGATDWISSDCASTYNSLRRLGKPVQYLEYDGEGHVMEKPANIIDLWQRRLAWLDRYLGTAH